MGHDDKNEKKIKTGYSLPADIKRIDTCTLAVRLAMGLTRTFARIKRRLEASVDRTLAERSTTPTGQGIPSLFLVSKFCHHALTLVTCST
jgi:hypothetical protein